MAHKRTFTLPASQVRPSDRNFAGADPHRIKPMRRVKKPGVATDRRIGNATSQGTYNGAEVCMPALRPVLTTPCRCPAASMTASTSAMAV